MQISRPADLPQSNHYASIDRDLLSKEYTYLWSIAVVLDNHKADAMKSIRTAVLNKSRYEHVQALTLVPWYVIAALHMREASFNFHGCLANGDPWNRQTVNVPAGKGPWGSWGEAAIWSLEYEGMSRLMDWSIGSAFRRMEAYNGWGYRTGGVRDFKLKDKHHRPIGTFHGSMQDTDPKNASPYIYNGTQFYRAGRVIEDHSFYPPGFFAEGRTAVDENLGCMAFLKALAQSGEKVFA